MNVLMLLKCSIHANLNSVGVLEEDLIDLLGHSFVLVVVARQAHEIWAQRAGLAHKHSGLDAFVSEPRDVRSDGVMEYKDEKRLYRICARRRSRWTPPTCH